MQCKDCWIYQSKEVDILRQWHEIPSIAQWTKNNTILEKLENYLWEIKKLLVRIADEECPPKGCFL